MYRSFYRSSIVILTLTLVSQCGLPATAQHTPAASSNVNAPKIKHRVKEAYPSALLASIERRNRNLADRLESGHGPTAEFVITISSKWPQNSAVKVAFLDGNSALHKAVAEAASEWNKFCNIKLDFGLDTATGNYRRWKTTDQTRAADIRVSFDQIGYYSLVGTDSRNPQIGDPGEPDGGRAFQRSMNFEGFKDELPEDYAGVVLHEFGHALGLQHEHQHPTEGCDSEFRWADDPGYVPTRDQFNQFVIDSQSRRPGIYTVLGGPPNKWPKAVVDFNLRQLTDSHAYKVTGHFDRDSIMKYFFEDWMFNSGANSHCFSAGENIKLSDNDKFGIAQEYPKAGPPPAAPIAEIADDTGESSEQRSARIEKQRLAVVKQLTKASDQSDTELQTHYKSLESN